VVLDLAALEYLSSAGIRSVVKARKSLEGRGASLALVNLQPPVQKVFDIVKALPSSQIFGSATELDAYLDMMQRRARRG
jgi:anti-anti-sigma factor